jgi:hypothetical protein
MKAVLHMSFFKGVNALGNRYYNQFESSYPGEKEREIPAPIVALVATAVSHCCRDFIPMPFDISLLDWCQFQGMVERNVQACRFYGDCQRDLIQGTRGCFGKDQNAEAEEIPQAYVHAFGRCLVRQMLVYFG